MVNADLVVDRDADDGGVVAASDRIDVLAGGQELQAGDERGVSLLDALQFLLNTKQIFTSVFQQDITIVLSCKSHQKDL